MSDQDTNPDDLEGGDQGGDGGAEGGDGPLEGPDAYAFDVPDLKDLELPEGFDAEKFQLQLAEDDPRIPELKALAHERGWSQGDMDSVARFWAKHEIREQHQAAQAAQEQLQALGPNPQSRLESLERVVRGRFPESQAEALLGDITSAEGVKALESLLGTANRQPNGAQPGGKPDLGSMSIDERLSLATQQRGTKRGPARRR